MYGPTWLHSNSWLRKTKESLFVDIFCSEVDAEFIKMAFSKLSLFDKSVSSIKFLSDESNPVLFD